MAEGTLSISPQELKFRFELRKQIPTELRLSNPTGAPVAFKVKTTSPRKYCVRPNTGVVEPYGAVAVTVIMQQQKEWPSDAAMCKDKFLVQTVAVGAGASQQPDDLAALFSKESGERVTETKLKVSYVMANVAVSPIPEHEGEDGMDSSYMPRSSYTPAGTGEGKYENAMASLGVATEERNNAMKEANKLRQELSTAVQQVELLQHAVSSKQGGVAGKGSMSSPKKTFAFSILHILLTALFAFLLGRFT